MSVHRWYTELSLGAENDFCIHVVLENSLFFLMFMCVFWVIPKLHKHNISLIFLSDFTPLVELTLKWEQKPTFLSKNFKMYCFKNQIFSQNECRSSLTLPKCFKFDSSCNMFQKDLILSHQLIDCLTFGTYYKYFFQTVQFVLYCLSH